MCIACDPNSPTTCCQLHSPAPINRLTTLIRCPSKKKNYSDPLVQIIFDTTLSNHLQTKLGQLDYRLMPTCGDHWIQRWWSLLACFNLVSSCAFTSNSLYSHYIYACIFFSRKSDIQTQCRVGKSPGKHQTVTGAA